MAIRDEQGYTKASLDIGDWDMDADATLGVAHGLSATEFLTIRSCQIMIIDDNSSNVYPFNYDINNNCAGWWRINSSTFALSRRASGTFDSTTFDKSTATTPEFAYYNRGTITFEYIPD